MADVKWIKISTGIFNDEAFEIIDDMPEADAIELIWFKLLVFAGKQNNNGLFLFKDSIAYTDEMLASIFHRPLNTVRLAMSTFMNLGMVEQIDGVYAIPNWDKYQNLDAYEQKKLRDKEYSKKYREKQKLLLEEKRENKKSSDESSDDSRFCSYSISNSNSISFSNSIKEIIDYLNIVTNSNYTYKNKSNNKHINARLEEGHTVDEFKTVIDKMQAKWGNDPKMSQYLRPETLFSNKFESYLNMKEVKTKNKTFNDKQEAFNELMLSIKSQEVIDE